MSKISTLIVLGLNEIFSYRNTDTRRDTTLRSESLKRLIEIFEMTFCLSFRVR